MTVRLSVTQCKIDCNDNLGRLVLRLNDSSLSSVPGCRFLPINVQSSCIDKCTGKTKYIIEYDESLLADPGSYLTASDFTLVCVDAGDEYAIEQAAKNQTPIDICSIISDCFPPIDVCSLGYFTGS